MLMPSQSPSAARLKVLHVAFTMHARGTETWLMNVWRRIDKSRFHFDFLTFEHEEGVYDREIKALGGNLIPVPHVSRRGAFLRRLRKVMVENGPYDIIHAHPFTLSGLVLLQAARAGIPVRITHAHTNRRKVQRDQRWSRRFYGWLSRRLIKGLSTGGLAASMDAATSLFGDQWWFDPRWQVMHCGVDLRPFENPVNPVLRAEFGLTGKSKVIGHVGAFRIEKNHDFIIHVFEQIAAGDPAAVLLLVGDGPLRPDIERLVASKKLERRVIFAGERQDVADCLRLMDLFIFPSLYEGLGLALIEAQAAGLPCLISEAIPQEAEIASGSIMRLSLYEGIDPWIEKARLLLSAPKPHAAQALEAVQQSDFNIDYNVARLTNFYERLYVERLGG